MTNIAIADPLQLHRSAFALIINSFEGFRVVCQAASGEDIISYTTQSDPPDIVLLNLEQRGMSGCATAAWLQEHHPHIKILIISRYNHEIVIAPFMRTGIRAFLHMGVEREVLQKALRHIAEEDGLWVGGNDGKMLNLIRQFGDKTALDKFSLSAKEILFIKYAFYPESMEEIAVKMNMSRRSTYNLMKKICKKLGVKTREGMLAWSERNGVLHL